MAIPLDIEDILGAGCLASIGRAISSLSCLWLGASTGIIAMSLGATGAELVTTGSTGLAPADFLRVVMTRCLLGPLVLFGTIYVLVFFPLVLAVYFTFARGDHGTIRKWVIYAAVVGLFSLLSTRSWVDASLLATIMGTGAWGALIASLVAGAYFFHGWQQQRLAHHLVAIAAENDDRRKSLAEEYGTAMGDREFATGDKHLIPPPPNAGIPKPEPPLPGSRKPRSGEDPGGLPPER